MSILFTSIASGNTITVNWMNGASLYDTSTCTTGEDLYIPTHNPTKYGYSFNGWGYGVIYGAGSQSTIPTPTNPVYPAFLSVGNIPLRALSDGNTTIADTYDTANNTITRRIHEKILNGTENWTSDNGYFRYTIADKLQGKYFMYCTHFQYTENTSIATTNGQFGAPNTSNSIYFNATDYADVTAFTTFLAQQYANGTPVIVYYPMATTVTESLQ